MGNRTEEAITVKGRYARRFLDDYSDRAVAGSVEYEESLIKTDTYRDVEYGLSICGEEIHTGYVCDTLANRDEVVKKSIIETQVLIETLQEYLGYLKELAAT